MAGLARFLGSDRCGQWVAVLLAATLPMGLLQATSTQTDYVMTFWLAGFILLLWNLYMTPRWSVAFNICGGKLSIDAEEEVFFILGLDYFCGAID